VVETNETLKQGGIVARWSCNVTDCSY